jgi:hypothetical protein
MIAEVGLTHEPCPSESHDCPSSKRIKTLAIWLVSSSIPAKDLPGDSFDYTD